MGEFWGNLFELFRGEGLHKFGGGGERHICCLVGSRLGDGVEGRVHRDGPERSEVTMCCGSRDILGGTHSR